MTWENVGVLGFATIIYMIVVLLSMLYRKRKNDLWLYYE